METAICDLLTFLCELATGWFSGLFNFWGM